MQLPYVVYDGDGELRDQDMLGAFRHYDDAVRFVYAVAYMGDCLLLYNEHTRELMEYSKEEHSTGTWRKIL